MNILVAIAYHGTKNEKHLHKLLKTYREMPYNVSIVILSNIDHDLGSDVEVIVGYPSSNPRSLPFAHRTLFRDRMDKFDYFIYSEDDTLVRTFNIEAFIKASKILPSTEIAGFLRSETEPNGDLHYSSCHSFFRWIPGSACERNGKFWAEFSNQHSGCFIATREQIKRGFTSQGLPITPHAGRLGLQETAATDLYVSCGLRRLICIDDIASFTLPHLPNAYIGKLGIPSNELLWRFEALKEIHEGKRTTAELINPETKLPGGRGSKNYREEPDSKIAEMIGSTQVNILIWGTGDGTFEKSLCSFGHSVSVVPLDSIMDKCCRYKNLKIHNNKSPKYDVIVLANILHLVEDPKAILIQVSKLLKSGGQVIVRVPNFNDAYTLRQRYCNKQLMKPWNRKEIGATPFKRADLKLLAVQSNFNNISIKTKIRSKFNTINFLTFGLFSPVFSPHLYMKATIS